MSALSGHHRGGPVESKGNYDSGCVYRCVLEDPLHPLTYRQALLALNKVIGLDTPLEEAQQSDKSPYGLGCRMAIFC